MSRKEQLFDLLKANPNDSFLNFAIALEYINSGDDIKGLEYFKGVVDKDPNYLGTYYHLGKLYERNNEKELALQTYEKGIQLTFGKDAQAHRELQEAYNELIELEED